MPLQGSRAHIGVYVYIYIYTHTHSFRHTRICIYIYIYVYMYVVTSPSRSILKGPASISLTYKYMIASNRNAQKHGT